MATSEAELRDSMQQYGKQKLSERDQVEILYFILEDAKNKLVQDSEIYNLIANYQSILNEEKNLKNAIKTVNNFIIDLETKDQNSLTINYLKEHGLYRIIYRNPQLMGEELPLDDRLHKLLREGFRAVIRSTLLTILFAATAFISLPFWLAPIVTGLFVGSSAYLSGILYGVVNDLFATHANLPYFLLGHQKQQTSLLRTNDKIAQGIAWGVVATYDLVALAALIFTVVATITACFVPVATFLLPVMMIAMPLIAIGAEFFARRKAREYIGDGDDFINIGANLYQKNGLNYMCPTVPERAAWYANSDRNLFGYTNVPFIGLGALIGLIVLSAVNKSLPPMLFASPIIAIAIPGAFAALACITLAAAGAYMYVNRNKQLDDRYRLEFDRAAIELNLFLDEDMTYVCSLMKTKNKNGSSIDINPLDSAQHAYGSFFGSKPVPKSTDVLRVELDDVHGLACI